MKLQKPPGYRDPNLPFNPAPRPPPTKAALPLAFQSRQKLSSNCCRRFCCCLFILIIVVLLLVVILGGLFYLWFDPKIPVFHLQSFKFTAFNVTKKSDGTYLNAATIARIEIRNPNEKMVYHFGESQVGFTAGDKDNEIELGSTSLPEFRQGKRNATSLKIETNVKDELIEDGVGSRLLDQFASKKLKVNIEVKTGVGIGVELVKTGLLGVDVLCGGVTLKDLEGGDMPTCTINTLKW